MKKLSSIEKNFFVNEIHLEMAIENAIYDKKINSLIDHISNYVLHSSIPGEVYEFMSNKYCEAKKQEGPGFAAKRNTILETMNFIYYQLTPCNVN